MKKTMLLLAIFVASLWFVWTNSALAKSCTEEYAPVCWVDRVTYSNKCDAWDVKIAHEWVCEIKKTDKICTTEYMPVCWVDGVTYSNKCDAWDTKIAYKGECKAKDKVCTTEYMPVCWADWVTYGNKCAAWNVMIAHDWECKKTEKKKFDIEFPAPISSEKEFLEKYGKICSTAHDWVNTILVRNGKFEATTLIWTIWKQNPAYKCIAFNWLKMTDQLKANYSAALKNLPVKYQEKASSALEKFFSSEKDFVKKVEKSQKVVEAIDNLYYKVKNKEATYLLDYLKYEVINAFERK